MIRYMDIIPDAFSVLVVDVHIASRSYHHKVVMCIAFFVQNNHQANIASL